MLINPRTSTISVIHPYPTDIGPPTHFHVEPALEAHCTRARPLRLSLNTRRGGGAVVKSIALEVEGNGFDLRNGRTVNAVSIINSSSQVEPLASSFQYFYFALGGLFLQSSILGQSGRGLL
ncbi:hypothetical protein EVAR_59209_1 [Eumeta japonica]|uniref:Uncharacterized protein n=1 Tax=Eumeta variegata TaxID=151549 RepID=A0A4C1YYF3_EUMVA|nr:hypothetical protein EVAR_59209_1 [Eumeta japonica]